MSSLIFSISFELIERALICFPYCKLALVVIFCVLFCFYVIVAHVLLSDAGKALAAVSVETFEAMQDAIKA